MIHARDFVSHKGPTKVKCLDQEVRQSFNEHIPYYTLCVSIAICFDGWPSEQTNEEMIRRGKWDGKAVLSCLQHHLPSPAVSVVICCVVLIRPLSTDTQHTALQYCMALSLKVLLLLSVFCKKVWGKEKKRGGGNVNL